MGLALEALSLSPWPTNALASAGLRSRRTFSPPLATNSATRACGRVKGSTSPPCGRHTSGTVVAGTRSSASALRSTTSAGRPRAWRSSSTGSHGVIQCRSWAPPLEYSTRAGAWARTASWTARSSAAPRGRRARVATAASAAGTSSALEPMAATSSASGTRAGAPATTAAPGAPSAGEGAGSGPGPGRPRSSAPGAQQRVGVDQDRPRQPQHRRDHRRGHDRGHDHRLGRGPQQVCADQGHQHQEVAERQHGVRVAAQHRPLGGGEHGVQARRRRGQHQGRERNSDQDAGQDAGHEHRQREGSDGRGGRGATHQPRPPHRDEVVDTARRTADPVTPLPTCSSTAGRGTAPTPTSGAPWESVSSSTARPRSWRGS